MSPRRPAATDAGSPDETTWRPRVEVTPVRARSLLLTVLYHPELRRIGEVAHLRGLDEDRACQVSRTLPVFAAAGDRPGGGLADPYLSRTPLLLLPAPGGRVLLHGPGLAVTVDGRPLAGPRELGPHELEDGVTLQFAGRIVLLLHIEPQAGRVVLPRHDLVGDCAALHGVRADVLQVAGLALPVLLRGESGTGKEQVARALHAASGRADQPYVTVNLAALNPQTAVAELLGHRRGAFTGAIRSHDGYFRVADGGTVFLDEVGDAPLDVQAALLQVIETGELQPLGGGSSRVDVRIVAATEIDLEAAVLTGKFRLSLLHRLAGYEIWLPPLRQRRADIPRLLMHLIRAELQRVAPDQATRLIAGDPIAWLPPSLVASLVRLDWPGNVRQLNNVARQLVALALAGRDPRSSAMIDRLLTRNEPVLDEPPPLPAPPPPGRARMKIGGVALAAALARNHWKIDVTARELGISKTSLYALIARSPGLHTAGDISRAELLRCHESHGGVVQRMAEELHISVRALQLRMRELRLPPGGSGDRA